MDLEGAGRLPTITITADPLLALPDVEVVAIPFSRDGDDFVLGPGAEPLLDALGVDLVALLQHHDSRGAAGDVVEQPVLAGVPGTAPEKLTAVLLVGVGQATPSDLRRAGAALARRVRGCHRVATTVPTASEGAALEAFAEGVLLGSFSYSLRTSDAPAAVEELILAGQARSADAEQAVARATVIGHASALARALATMPADRKNPARLADLATSIGADRGLDVRVWDERELAKDGFGGILGVGQASATPPRLVRIDYTPPRTSRRTPHIVLAGKGITFDTGGLSIKSAEAMMTMKRDMTGAGVVLAVLGALPELDCRVRVTGLLACAENAVSGHALRPGDVIRHYGGRTSEVTNTDAEGRLVLADALAYAVAELRPNALVDIATLTGAIKISLGLRTAGLFANDDALADHLRAAGETAGERFWRMPLAADYEERLESPIADADNAAGTPGAITAALFLQHFAGGLPWAHLDIASVGDSPVDAFEWSSGPTGFGARALLRWLTGPRPLDGVAGRRTRGKP